MSRDEMDGLLSEISYANAKIPRRVHFDRVSKNVLGWILCAFLFAILGSIWISFSDIKNLHVRDILRRNGSTVNANVVKNSANRDGVQVRYTFSVDGVLYYGRAEMKTDHYSVPGVVEKIPIRYLPDDPHINQPVSWEWFSVWDIVPFLFVLFIMVTAATVIVTGLRQKTLACLGVVVAGRVTGCTLNQKLFKVYYEFTTEENTEMEGSTELPDKYEVGTPIPIIYLRSEPKRNNRYPVGGFHIAE